MVVTNHLLTGMILQVLEFSPEMMDRNQTRFGRVTLSSQIIFQPNLTLKPIEQNLGVDVHNLRNVHDLEVCGANC